MVVGSFTNAGTTLFGGVLDALLSQRLPECVRASIVSIFGLCSLGIGILLVTKCVSLPMMVLATLVDALIGEFYYLEKGINTAITEAQQLFARSDVNATHESFIQSYVAIIILFCASGTGIFRAMYEGIADDPSTLITKLFLDFFTAITFARSLGTAASTICVSILVTQLAFTTCTALILLLTTPAMMAGFSTVSGLLLLAASLHICGIKMSAVVNILPALPPAMPSSAT